MKKAKGKKLKSRMTFIGLLLAAALIISIFLIGCTDENNDDKAPIDVCEISHTELQENFKNGTWDVLIDAKRAGAKKVSVDFSTLFNADDTYFPGIIIDKDIDEIKFKGANTVDKSYFIRHFSVAIKERDSKLTVIFDSISVNLYSTLALYFNEMEIISVGSKNELFGNTSPTEVVMPISASALTLSVFAPLTIKGADGMDGSGQGQNGGNGAEAIRAGSLLIRGDSSLNIIGGNGGNGTKGMDGWINGSPGAKGSNAAKKTNAGDGGNGEAGYRGFNGGDGGRGVAAIRLFEGNFSVEDTVSVFVIGGSSGNGGAGGNGTKGGNGGKGGEYFEDTSTYRKGGNGGNGGEGGRGGNGGSFYVPQKAILISVQLQIPENIHITEGKNGMVGNFGLGGEGGAAGLGGYCRKNQSRSGIEGNKGKNGFYGDTIIITDS